MKTLFLIILFLIGNNIFAQTADKQAVEAVINFLFDGMKKGDSTIARSVFHPKAITQAIGYSSKTRSNYFKYENRFEDFMKSIGTPHNEVWDERPGTYEIRIDNQMAHVWVSYEFYLGGKFSHCGVDNITLYKAEKDWKIVYLIDTIRKDNCVK